MLWTNYYKKKIARHEKGYPAYHELKIQENIPFINALQKYSSIVDNLLKIGLWPCSYAIELKKRGYDVFGVDDEEGILSLTKKNAEQMSTHIANLIQADMFNLPFRDDKFVASYSLGVLEHYEDSYISDALKEATRVSEKHIFVVPTDIAIQSETAKALSLTWFHGDERYLPAEYWEDLVKKIGMTIHEKFGYWIPNMRSKIKHPKDPQTAFGKGLYAGFVISRNT